MENSSSTIPAELSIPVFDIEYDKEISIKSYTNDEPIFYNVNLFFQTCTCLNFTSKRINYSKGDLRRLCKHLMEAYDRTPLMNKVSECQRLIIQSKHGAKDHFRHIFIEYGCGSVMVFFDTKDGWWDIFMNDKKGIYKRYGYSPIEKRFSYDEKPIGYTVIVKTKLNELKKQLDNNEIFSLYSANKEDLPKGCIIFIVFISIIILFFLFKLL